MKIPSLLSMLMFLSLAATSPAQSVTDLVQEAQQDFLKNNLTEAREKFELVRKLEPNNGTAIRYLRMIFVAQANSGEGDTMVLKQQLKSTILDRVDLKEASLAEALDFVRKKINLQNAGKAAVNIVFNVDEVTKAKTITLALQHAPASEVLRYISELAGVQFKYDRFAVMVVPRVAALPAAKP